MTDSKYMGGGEFYAQECSYVEEIVIVRITDGEPTHIIRKNGDIKWHKLSKMNYGDFVRDLKANQQIQQKQ